jgi:hypothetical protein
MVVLSLSKGLVDDCRLLHDLPADVVSELCTLAVEHVQHGATPEAEKKYRKAASQPARHTEHFALLAACIIASHPSHPSLPSSTEALSVDAVALTAVVHGLGFLLLEATKRSVTAEDFAASVSPLSLPPEVASAISASLASHSRVLLASLSAASLVLPHYADLQWRLDVEVSRRSISGRCEAMYLLELTVAGGSSSREEQKLLMQSDYAAMLQLEKELEAAVKGLQSKEARRILRYVK